MKTLRPKKKPIWGMLIYRTTSKGVDHMPEILNQMTAQEARQAKVCMAGGNTMVVFYPMLKKGELLI